MAETTDAMISVQPAAAYAAAQLAADEVQPAAAEIAAGQFAAAVDPVPETVQIVEMLTAAVEVPVPGEEMAPDPWVVSDPWGDSGGSG